MPIEAITCARPCAEKMPERIHIVDAVPTLLEFPEANFEVSFDDNNVFVRDRDGNQAIITQKSQQVPYKATILGGIVLTEKKQGAIDYEDYFALDWHEEYTIPELQLKRSPHRIFRHYAKGQRIELGVEKAAKYCVRYHDGVTARFERSATSGFDFRFSTGFYGSFWHDDDGSYTLKFKGDKLADDEDDLHSQSKFVVSRSKYSGMLLLILQDNATVCIA